jgi:4-amino-4-deoxy-L-arabinose transferase-like glycosyltransferase
MQTLKNYRIFVMHSVFLSFVLLAFSQIVFNKNSLPLDMALHFLFWIVFWLIGSLYYYGYSLKLDEKSFLRYSVILALVLRVAGVFWFYWIYELYNGLPYEALYSDQMFYHDQGMMLSEHIKAGVLVPIDYFAGDFADFGYPYFNAVIYSITGDNIIAVRLVQAVISSISVFLLFRVARSFIEEETSRLAVVVMIFSPILIRYTGTHLKETVFIFLMLAGSYFTIRSMKNARLNIIYIALALISFYAIFSFRIMTGMICVSVFVLYYLYYPWQAKSLFRYFTIPFFIAVFAFIIIYSPAYEELTTAYETGSGYSEAVEKMSTSSILSNISILPVNMILAVSGPYPNMLSNLPLAEDRMFFQQLIGPETFAKCLLAVVFIFGFIKLFRTSFRNNVFILVMVFINLFLLSYTGVMLNLRHFMPFYPFLIILFAVGIYHFSGKIRAFNLYYFILLFVIVILFNFFKLSDFNII